jgi:hypothetical protein
MLLLKCNLFSPRYSRQVSHFTFNNILSVFTLVSNFEFPLGQFFSTNNFNPSLLFYFINSTRGFSRVTEIHSHLSNLLKNITGKNFLDK